jgi:hypothetical protein
MECIKLVLPSFTYNYNFWECTVPRLRTEYLWSTKQDRFVVFIIHILWTEEGVEDVITICVSLVSHLFFSALISETFPVLVL